MLFWPLAEIILFSALFCLPPLLGATNAWIPPLQITRRETFLPISAVGFPWCVVVVQPGVWSPAGATVTHFRTSCVETILLPVTCYELLVVSFSGWMTHSEYCWASPDRHGTSYSPSSRAGPGTGFFAGTAHVNYSFLSDAKPGIRRETSSQRKKLLKSLSANKEDRRSRPPAAVSLDGSTRHCLFVKRFPM